MEKVSFQFVPHLLILGDLSRQEFRLWWNSLPEIVRLQAFVCKNPSEWLGNFFLETTSSGFSTDCEVSNPFRDVLDSATHSSSVNAKQYNGFKPDFIVLLRTWSGEYTESLVQQLYHLFPLVPILTVQGNWCEGETRNGTPLPGVHALTWYDFAAMFPLEFAAFSRGYATIWSLPPESLPEQRVLFELQRTKLLEAVQVEKKDFPKTLHFLIESEDFAQFQFMQDFCLRTHWGDCETRIFSHWTKKDEMNSSNKMEPDVQFLFFDFPDFNPSTIVRFQQEKESHSQTISIGFCEFPRPDEWNFLLNMGCNRIFPKPFRLADLQFFVSETFSAGRR